MSSPGWSRRNRCAAGLVMTVLAMSVVVATGALMSGPATASTARSSASPAASHTASHTAAPVAPVSLHLVVGTATDPATGGYWIVAANGGVFSFDAPFYGSAGALTLTRPVVGMAATPDGKGYWLVASDGGIFSYGDAAFDGSMGGHHLNQPIVGMAATADGKGYWLVASDGGIFSFGDAAFDGSMGGHHLNQPIVGMAATADGKGYWLVAADGGIFSFGDARFEGSTGGITLNSPVVGMQAGPGHGYWLVAADGGVFTFGTPFHGAATGQLRRAAAGLAATADGGYRVVASDGDVFGFGAPSFGSVDVPPLVGEIVGIDPGHDGGNAAAAGYISQPIDGGNFTESCDTVGTETAAGYSEHAFNFDVATRLAAILAGQGATIVLTRTTDTGVGPCVNQRAAIVNDAHADVAISIHADGGPVSGRGFDVIQPAPVISPISNNTAIVPASAELAVDVRNDFAAVTGEQESDYSGSGGIDERDNLGGLNLTTVPKVLIECANMQNPVDAALTESPQWRQLAAQGLADGITAFLVARQVP